MSVGITILCLNYSLAQDTVLESIHDVLAEQIKNNEKDAAPQYTLEIGNNIPSNLLKSSFFFYKNFVSPQDFNSCMFIPSCSVYAKNAIENKGIVRGYLMTFDRLCRCNGLSPRKYELDQESGRLIDPVQ